MYSTGGIVRSVPVPKFKKADVYRFALLQCMARIRSSLLGGLAAHYRRHSALLQGSNRARYESYGEVGDRARADEKITNFRDVTRKYGPKNAPRTRVRGPARAVARAAMPSTYIVT